MSQTDPRAEHGYILDLLTEIGKAYATPGCDPAKVLTKALADAERREAERCAKDVCMYCGGRALGHLPVIGPNQAGNYIHATPKATGEDVLCRASGIYSRLRAQAQADKEGK
mgnify:CR=1 FL=1